MVWGKESESPCKALSKPLCARQLSLSTRVALVMNALLCVGSALYSGEAALMRRWMEGLLLKAGWEEGHFWNCRHNGAIPYRRSDRPQSLPTLLSLTCSLLLADFCFGLASGLLESSFGSQGQPTNQITWCRHSGLIFLSSKKGTVLGVSGRDTAKLLSPTYFKTLRFFPGLPTHSEWCSSLFEHPFPLSIHSACQEREETV